MGDQLVFEATVKDPLGQSDTDSITLDVVGQPIKVWKHFDYTTDTTGKGEPKKVDPLIFDLNMDGKLDITEPTKKEMERLTVRPLISISIQLLAQTLGSSNHLVFVWEPTRKTPR